MRVSSSPGVLFNEIELSKSADLDRLSILKGGTRGQVYC